MKVTVYLDEVVPVVAFRVVMVLVAAAAAAAMVPVLLTATLLSTIIGVIDAVGAEFDDDVSIFSSIYNHFAENATSYQLYSVFIERML